MSREFHTLTPEVTPSNRAHRRRAEREARKAWLEEPVQVVLQEGLLALGLFLALETLQDLMEQEINRKCGVRGKGEQNPAGRKGYRNGGEAGQVVVGGRCLSIWRPRAVWKGGGEIELEVYKAAQNPDFLSQSVLTATVLGVSQRSHKTVLEAMAPAPAGDTVPASGLSKSAVGRRFQAEAEKVVEKFLTRPLQKRYLAVWIDALVEAGHAVIAAVGLRESGEKEVLGLREGSTENVVLCREFLESLRARGLCADRGMLFIVDGGKGIAAALRETFGAGVAIQRCRVHKKRNVAEKLNLPEPERGRVLRQLEAAWSEPDAGKAAARIEALALGLEQSGQGKAAASLREVSVSTRRDPFMSTQRIRP
jgi:transposase-like protein